MSFVPNRRFQRPTGGGGGGGLVGALVGLIVAPSAAKAELARHEAIRKIDTEYNRQDYENKAIAQAAGSMMEEDNKHANAKELVTHKGEDEELRRRNLHRDLIGPDKFDKATGPGGKGILPVLDRHNVKRVGDLEFQASVSYDRNTGPGGGAKIPNSGPATRKSQFPFVQEPDDKGTGYISPLTPAADLPAAKQQQGEDFGNLKEAVDKFDTSGGAEGLHRSEAFAMSPQFAAHTLDTEYTAAKAAHKAAGTKLKKKDYEKSWWAAENKRFDDYQASLPPEPPTTP